MDSLISNLTPQWIWLQILLVNLIFLPFLLRLKTTRNNLRYPRPLFSTNFIIFICWIFCIYSTFDGDFFHYRTLFHKVDSSNTFRAHLEDVYVWIIRDLSFHSYTLFRAIVWGVALLFYRKSFKRLGINNHLIWVGFIGSTLVNFAYMRGVLGFGIFLLGYTYIIRPLKNQSKSNLIAILIIACSLFFHKSMFVVLAAGIASILPLKKWFYILIILSFPIFIIIFKTWIIPSFTDDTVGSNYLQESALSFGIGHSLFNYLCYTFVFGTLISLFPLFWERKMPVVIEKSYLFLSYILILYGLAYFALEMENIGGLYLSNRIFLMSFVIFPILYYYQLYINNSKIFNLILIFSAYAAVNYRLLYAFYLQTLDMPK